MKKKMSREERAEFKNGKYRGGPAEERAEKKHRRMADGGVVENKPVAAMKPISPINDPWMSGPINDGDQLDPKFGLTPISPKPATPPTAPNAGLPPGLQNGPLPKGLQNRPLPPGLAKRGPQAMPVPSQTGTITAPVPVHNDATNGIPKNTMKAGGLVKGAGCAIKGVKAHKIY